jgi:hypothetical protein
METHILIECVRNVLCYKDKFGLVSKIIVSILPWIIHDFYIKSYVYAIFDIGSVITNLISIYQIKN